jgi:hypothetical protein
LERLRQRREQNRDIPHAILQDPEEESNRRRRNRLWLAAFWLSAFILIGIILGVTLGVLSNSNGNTPPTEPTPSPTKSQNFVELYQLMQSLSFDGGAALNNTDSPQYKALTWLADNANLDDYPDWKRIQRYALAVFYYSTNGDEWHANDGWLSDYDECTAWFIQETSEEYPACWQLMNISIPPRPGSFAQLTLKKNNLNGTLPAELALLSEGLCKCSWRGNARGKGRRCGSNHLIPFSLVQIGLI